MTMFKRMVIALMLMAAAGMALAQEVNRIDFNGVGFDFDATIAAGVNVTAVRADPVDMMYPGGPRPAHTRFDLLDETGTETGSVYVFQTADFAAYPAFAAELTALQTILRERPDLAGYVSASASADVLTLPYLPTPTATQVLRAQPAYVDNGVVSGVRYLTIYAQDLSPFTSDQVRYTFQGLSADGGAYVAVEVWLKAGVLPETIPADFNDAALTENYQTYLTETLSLLQGAPASSFTPLPDALDSLALSLRVTGVSAPNVRPPLEETPSLGAIGGTWTLVSYGDPAAPSTVLDGTSINLTIDSLGVSGSAGCNRYFGGYAYAENTISFAALGSTRMACEPAIMAQEAAYLAALGSAATFEIGGDTLRIVYAGGVLTFERGG
jgi:heat shock protein HslJ